MNKVSKIILLCFMIFSLFISVFGGYRLYLNVHKIDRCTDEIMAVVSHIRIDGSSRSNNYRETYTPEFEYEYKGKMYNVEYGIHYPESQKDTFKEGKVYKIWVDPKRPYMFIVEGHEDDVDAFAIIGPIAGFMMFLMFFGIYIYVEIKCKKQLT